MARSRHRDAKLDRLREASQELGPRIEDLTPGASKRELRQDLLDLERIREILLRAKVAPRSKAAS